MIDVLSETVWAKGREAPKPKFKPLVYLASPFSDPDPEVREWRFQQACQATAALLSRGDHVYAPIVYGKPLDELGNLIVGEGWWRTFGLNVLRRCDCVYVLLIEGWDRSKGIQAELLEADRLGLPIFYVNSDGEVQA